MTPFDFVNPPGLGTPRGYTHGMLAPVGGRLLFVAGQTARDPDGRIVDGGMAEQWDRALANVLEVVRTAGGEPDSVGRMTIYVTDLEAYLAGRTELGAVWRERMGRHFPAVALVEVSGLVDAGAVVEIEATAVIP